MAAATIRDRMTAWLEPYRACESEDDLAITVGDPRVLHVLAAWRRLGPQWKRPRRRRPTDVHRLWEWLWSGVYYDLDALATAAKLSATAAVALLRACAHARIAYPDGSISEYANYAIAEYVELRGRKRIGLPRDPQTTTKPPRKKPNAK